MSILHLLQSQLGGDNLRQMSQTLGSNDEATSSAISAALPTLLGALARNSSTPQGAQSLHNALNKDHSGGGVLDNLAGFLGNSNAGPGAAILGHIFGQKQGRVERGLSQSTGLDSAKMSKLMVMLAPMVLGALGKKQREGSLDAGGLSGLLTGEKDQVERSAPSEMGILNRLLDTDGDGDVDMTDLASKGMGLLGGLLGGRR